MSKETFSSRIISFLSDLHFPLSLPEHVEVMNPFHDPETMEIVHRFYHEFYHDHEERWIIIGINPGRFGGGVTGIPFTDPIRLEQKCHIPNPWQKKQELSSAFIYEMIEAFGGVDAFYKKFYISAVSPLGFTKANKNLNYYDDKTLMSNIKEFVVDCMKRQLQFGIHRNVGFCLGDGKNFKYMKALNDEMKFFKVIIPLSHPRFIMQYRLKRKAEYIQNYLSKFQEYTF